MADEQQLFQSELREGSLLLGDGNESVQRLWSCSKIQARKEIINESDINQNVYVVTFDDKPLSVL